MSDTALLVLGALDLLGLAGLFVWLRAQAARRAAGKERPPRSVRIAVALVALVVVVAFPLVMVTSIKNRVDRPARQRAELMRIGTPAVAEITHLEETGTVINRRPEMRVRLTVHPDAAPAFAAEATWPFSVLDVQTYRVGTRVNVTFDPADPGSIAVVGVAAPND